MENFVKNKKKPSKIEKNKQYLGLFDHQYHRIKVLDV